MHAVPFVLDVGCAHVDACTEVAASPQRRKPLKSVPTR